MADSAQSRNGMVTTKVDHAPLLEINHLRDLALDPAVSQAAAGYARVWFPRSSLARLGA